MQLPVLNFETAFAMTALSSWSLVGMLWLVGRHYPRQGVAWVVCIVMFQNIQISVLSFLMMLQDRRHAEERMAAEIDVLTQLPNRRSLERRVADKLPGLYRQNAWFSVVLLDIDHFKQVNDSLGHDAGDLVLQHVATVLRQQLRPGELLARYGGEEFVATLLHADAAQATAIAARMVASVASQPVVVQGRTLHITVSAGVHAQQLSPQDLQHMDATAHWRSWVREADGAMYEAKRSGRNRHVLARPGVEAPVTA